MAFFGLTALGAQDPCAVSSDGIQHLHVFTVADWETSFRKQLEEWNMKTQRQPPYTDSSSNDNKEGKLPLSRLQGLMQDVYRGPVPPGDVRLLEKWVVADGTATSNKNVPTTMMTLSTFMVAVQGARAEAEHLVAQRKMAPGPSCETTSWHEYSRNLSKCKAVRRAPPQKQTVPLTAQQEIGWESPTLVVRPETRLPKRSSEETKWASEMIKAGRFLF